MIVDTSALTASLRSEPEADDFMHAILGAEGARISAATLLEAAMVAVGRKGPDGREDVYALCDALGLEIAAFTPEQARLAAEAFLKFGKGRHSAKLNYGDCISYALAKAVEQPLLFKGDDFSKTDVQPALARKEG